jgi:hypothetical protein
MLARNAPVVVVLPARHNATLSFAHTIFSSMLNIPFLAKLPLGIHLAITNADSGGRTALDEQRFRRILEMMVGPNARISVLNPVMRYLAENLEALTLELSQGGDTSAFLSGAHEDALCVLAGQGFSGGSAGPAGTH